MSSTLHQKCCVLFPFLLPKIEKVCQFSCKIQARNTFCDQYISWVASLTLLTYLTPANLVLLCLPALPRAPINLRTSDVTATSLKLSWDSGDANSIQHYRIQYRRKTLDDYDDEPFTEIDVRYRTHDLILNLEPYTEYEMRVKAINDIGSSWASDPIEVLTGQRSESALPLRTTSTYTHTYTQTLYILYERVCASVALPYTRHSLAFRYPARRRTRTGDVCAQKAS